MEHRLPAIAFLVMAGLAACQGPAGTRAISVPGQHHLAVGDAVPLPDGSRLGYVRLVADSRCRPGVQCIRAGDADIELRWQPAGRDAVVATLNSDPRNRQQAPNQVEFGLWQVRLQSLDWSTPPVAALDIARKP